MPSNADLYRAWLINQLGLDPGGSNADLEQLVLANVQGVSSNRRFASGLYYASQGGGNAAIASPALNRLVLFPFPVGQRTTFDRIGIAVTTLQASTVMRLGIYASDSRMKPSALVVDGGTVTGDTTGAKTVTINQILNPGLYWLAYCAQVTALAALQVQAMAEAWSEYVGADTPAAGVAGCGYFLDGVTGALPGTFTFNTGNIFTGTFPRIMLRAV